MPVTDIFEPAAKYTASATLQQHESTTNAEWMLAARKIIDPKYGVMPAGAEAKKGGDKKGGKKGGKKDGAPRPPAHSAAR